MSNSTSYNTPKHPTGAAAVERQREKAGRRQAHIAHLQALQAAAQPQTGQPQTQYRTPPGALPGATVQAPTPEGTGNGRSLLATDRSS